MIDVFCQYSLGGYKIFYFGVEGTAEVSRESLFGLTAEVVSFLSRSGMKMILAPISDGRWMYLLNDIPTTSADEIGRHKQMSIVVLADVGDSLQQLQQLACMTIADVSGVERYFSSMVKESEGGLMFDYDLFTIFLSEIDAQQDENFGKLYDRISTNTAPILMYSGSSFASSANSYGTLIPSTTRRCAIKCRWDEELRQSEMHRSNVILEFINRIISILKIWKN